MVLQNSPAASLRSLHEIRNRHPDTASLWYAAARRPLGAIPGMNDRRSGRALEQHLIEAPRIGSGVVLLHEYRDLDSSLPVIPKLAIIGIINLFGRLHALATHL